MAITPNPAPKLDKVARFDLGNPEHIRELETPSLVHRKQIEEILRLCENGSRS